MTTASGNLSEGSFRLPPLLTPHLAAPGTDVLGHACTRAAAGELGAGDAVVSPGLASAGMAIVLEPEVPVETARQMAPLMMLAAADALGVLLPPKVAIEHRWPVATLLNGARVGWIGLRHAPVEPGEVPAWLAVAFSLRLSFPLEQAEPGANPGETCLAEEGGAELLAEDVLAAVATHFLRRLDQWQSDGFADIARDWLFRAEGRTSPVTVATPHGAVRARVAGLLPDVTLRLARPDGSEQLVAWCDPESPARAGP